METPAEMAEEELTSQAESSYSDFDVDDEKCSIGADELFSSYT